MQQVIKNLQLNKSRCTTYNLQWNIYGNFLYQNYGAHIIWIGLSNFILFGWSIAENRATHLICNWKIFGFQPVTIQNYLGVINPQSWGISVGHTCRLFGVLTQIGNYPFNQLIVLFKSSIKQIILLQYVTQMFHEYGSLNLLTGLHVWVKHTSHPRNSLIQ